MGLSWKNFASCLEWVTAPLSQNFFLELESFPHTGPMARVKILVAAGNLTQVIRTVRPILLKLDAGSVSTTFPVDLPINRVCPWLPSLQQGN